MSKKKYVVPAFLEVLWDGEMVFIPFMECKNNPEFAGQVVNRALAELESWCDRYGDLFELVGHRQGRGIVRFIARIKQEMGDDWPTLPDEFLENDEGEDPAS